MIHYETYPDILTVPQVAILLNICTKTAYQMIKNNEIKAFRLGKQLRIYKKDVFSFTS